MTVIGLAGYAQSGKDTLANMLVEQQGYTRLAFADVLRECLYALDPSLRTPRATLRNYVDHLGWDEAKRNPEVRELLQRLGTEVGRNILGPDIWVETAMRKVEPGGKYVFTDVRFPNEADAIARIGKVIRIIRTGYGPVNGHPSETAVDDYPYDGILLNDGDLSALYVGFWALEKTWLS
jgi:hypothetical protein